jgi:[ribosomal protein S5]-alanine N-acetyltransferase
MSQCPLLVAERVILRRPISHDIEDRLQCGRHREIVRMYGGDTRNLEPLTREEAVVWYERIQSNQLEWMIEHDGKCIGAARLTVDEGNRCARYAIGIFDISKLGIGLGTEVTQLVLNYAFNKLGLHRVDLRTLQYNTRAIACFEKCGFVREGVEREGALIEDQWETDVRMSILEQEHRSKTRIP